MQPGLVRILLPASLLLFSGGTHAAHEPANANVGLVISGQVSDSTTTHPLAAAQVAVKDTKYSAMTDAQGRYQVVVSDYTPGTEITVLVRRIGYRPATRAVRSSAHR